MKNKSNCLILCYLILPSFLIADESMFGWADEVMNQMQSQLKEMQHLVNEARSHATNALEQADQSLKGIGAVEVGGKIDLEIDGNFVKATISLPASKDKNKVDIQAKDNSLDGSINSGTRVLVTDGQVIRVSHQYISEDNNEDKGVKSAKYFSSMTSQSMLLPAKVNNLESTKAEFVDGKLILLMPKETKAMRGWRKIEVK